MENKRKPLFTKTIMALLVVALALVVGCSSLNEKVNLGSGSISVDSNREGISLNLPGTVEEVVSATSPAVVMITTKQAGGESPGALFNDPLFRHFFGDPYNNMPGREGFGSGFIISSDGYILTNEHVVGGAGTIEVTIAGLDSPLEAKVVGADHNLDLALLKVNTNRNLPFLKLGNSDQIKVGNWVIAIGNPYGLEHTVTVGVISAKGRPISVDDRNYENLLQTDASINPGNSGGPLLNLQGEVVGINTAISAEARGIGFAIPTSTVQRVLEDLRSGTSSGASWIGVSVRDVDEEIARSLGLADAEGVLILGVVNGGPAQKAGMRQYDVVTEINGVKTSNADDLVAAVRAAKVGEKISVLYFRNRQLDTVEITVAERPSNMR
jgi:S1-C subfamily serine protease